ncbi:MAG: hypothetical protein Q3999_03520 [Buchananella hordeovulneris]|nr:hypothetical protein [Buchananella hordeovulneris]
MAKQGPDFDFEDIVSQLQDDPAFKVGTFRAGAVGSGVGPAAGPRDYALAEPQEEDFNPSTYDPSQGSLVDAFNGELAPPGGDERGGWGGGVGPANGAGRGGKKPAWWRRLLGGKGAGADGASGAGGFGPGGQPDSPFGSHGRPRGLNDPDNDGAVV